MGNEIKKYIEELQKNKENGNNSYEFTKGDKSFFELLKTLRIDLVKILNSEFDISNEKVIKENLFFSLLEKENIANLNKKSLVLKLASFRKEYEIKLIGTKKINRKNKMVQVLISDVLNKINLVLRESIDDSESDLRKSENRIEFYDRVLQRQNNFGNINESDFYSLLANVESLYVMLKNNQINTGSPLMIINIYDGQNTNSKIEFMNELKGFTSLFCDKDYYTVYNPKKKSLIKFIFSLAPNFIHYCGHSSKNGIPLIFSEKSLSGQDISDIYLNSSGELMFCMLNSCSSSQIAQTIHNNCGTVTIGNSGNLINSNAQRFSVELYNLLRGGVLSEKIYSITEIFNCAIDNARNNSTFPGEKDFDNYELYINVI